jgi:hypothetical protein
MHEVVSALMHQASLLDPELCAHELWGAPVIVVPGTSAQQFVQAGRATACSPLPLLLLLLLPLVLVMGVRVQRRKWQRDVTAMLHDARCAAITVCVC